MIFSIGVGRIWKGILLWAMIGSPAPPYDGFRYPHDTWNGNAFNDYLAGLHYWQLIWVLA